MVFKDKYGNLYTEEDLNEIDYSGIEDIEIRLHSY
jgi:hypothetical protein